MTAMQRNYNHNGRGPMTAVNFITAHDGFTMYDLVTYAEKRNGCTPSTRSAATARRPRGVNKTAATATTGARMGRGQ